MCGGGDGESRIFIGDKRGRHEEIRNPILVEGKVLAESNTHDDTLKLVKARRKKCCTERCIGALIFFCILFFQLLFFSVVSFAVFKFKLNINASAVCVKQHIEKPVSSLLLFLSVDDFRDRHFPHISITYFPTPVLHFKPFFSCVFILFLYT